MDAGNARTQQALALCDEAVELFASYGDRRGEAALGHRVFVLGILGDKDIDFVAVTNAASNVDTIGAIHACLRRRHRRPRRRRAG